MEKHFEWKQGRAFLAAVFVVFGAWFCALAALSAHAEEAAKGSLNVAYHSKAEIAARMKRDALSLEVSPAYAVAPQCAAPYGNVGALRRDTLDGAIKTMNQIRFIAGLSDDVAWNEEYNRLAQAAAMVNYANGGLSHYPTMPAGMDGAAYELGRRGSSSCNLAMASWNCSLNWTIVKGWMDDGDASNIDRLGHRRWILNPPMGQTGFGAVYGPGGTYSAMYCFDRSDKFARQTQVAWPAQNMPVGYFGAEFPWSVSIGQYVEPGSVQVALTRVNDGKTWMFSAAGSNGYFNVENGGYGQKGCVIFRPLDVGGYQDGDVFQVVVTGKGVSLAYKVEFFDPDLGSMALKEEEVTSVDWAAVNAAARALPAGGTASVLSGSKFAVPAETLNLIAGTNKTLAFHVGEDMIFCLSGRQMKPSAAPWDVRISYRDGDPFKQGLPLVKKLLKEGKSPALRAFRIENTGSFPGSVSAIIQFGAEQAGKEVRLYCGNEKGFDFSAPQAKFTAVAGGQAAFVIDRPGTYLAVVY